MPGEDEERVVDPDAEADHRCRAGAKLGTSTRWATSDIAPTPTASPKTAMPIGRPMAISEPNATSRISAAASPISSPTPAAPRRRRTGRRPSPLAADPRSAPAPKSLSAPGRPRLTSRPGTAPGCSATRPSVGHRRARSSPSTSGGRQPRSRTPASPPAPGRAEVRAASRRAARSARPRPSSAASSKVRGPLESRPGTSNESSSSRPNRRRRRSRTRRPRARRRPRSTGGGRRSGPAGRADQKLLESWACIVTRPPRPRTSVSRRDFSRPIGRGAPRTFGRSRRRCRPLRWAGGRDASARSGPNPVPRRRPRGSGGTGRWSGAGRWRRSSRPRCATNGVPGVALVLAVAHVRAAVASNSAAR